MPCETAEIAEQIGAFLACGTGPTEQRPKKIQIQRGRDIEPEINSRVGLNKYQVLQLGYGP